jgi:hypothetical protein
VDIVANGAEERLPFFYNNCIYQVLTIWSWHELSE